MTEAIPQHLWRSASEHEVDRVFHRYSLLQEELILASTDATTCCIIALIAPKQWVSGGGFCIEQLHDVFFLDVSK